MEYNCTTQSRGVSQAGILVLSAHIDIQYSKAFLARIEFNSFALSSMVVVDSKSNCQQFSFNILSSPQQNLILTQIL